VNNVFNRQVNKSIAAYDQPLVWNTGFTYELQKYTKNKLFNTIVADWQISGLLAYSSGIPIASPTSSNNQSSWYFQNTLENRVPGQPLFLKEPNCHCVDPTKDFILNPAAWANPAPGQWGTAAPYYGDFRYARRPGEQLGIGRNFRIREKMTLEIRAEFFNVFNRLYLADPTVTAPQGTRSCTSGGAVDASGRCSAGTSVSGFGYINPTQFSVPRQQYPRNGQLVARFTF